MKKLIFDFDGTLVDSMDAWSSTMLRILDEHKISYSKDITKILTPLGYAGTAEYYMKEFGIAGPKERLIKQMNEYCLPAYRDRIPAKETVKEALQELKKRGYSLNVLTASPHSMLDVCLIRTDIYSLFDNVWSCDDFQTTKSDVNIYHMAAKRLGTTVEGCIFLDDNINADKTAKSAGMTVIGVFDKSSEDMVEQMKALCDGYIVRMEELVPLLDNRF